MHAQYLPLRVFSDLWQVEVSDFTEAFCSVVFHRLLAGILHKLFQNLWCFNLTLHRGTLKSIDLNICFLSIVLLLFFLLVLHSGTLTFKLELSFTRSREEAVIIFEFGHHQIYSI